MISPILQLKKIKGQDINKCAQVHEITTVQKKHNSNIGNSDIQVHVSDFRTNPINLNGIAANTSLCIPVCLYSWSVLWAQSLQTKAQKLYKIVTIFYTVHNESHHLKNHFCVIFQV